MQMSNGETKNDTTLRLIKFLDYNKVNVIIKFLFNEILELQEM